MLYFVKMLSAARTYRRIFEFRVDVTRLKMRNYKKKIKKIRIPETRCLFFSRQVKIAKCRFCLTPFFNYIFVRVNYSVRIRIKGKKKTSFCLV